MMVRKIPALAVFACVLVVSGQTETEKVVISYQTELSALAHDIAIDKGYYFYLGLEVEMQWYPSGAPQVEAALVNKSWDFGGAGVVPNIIGGPQGLIGVGISMDQSATNQLVGNREGAGLWPPNSMAGIPIVLSPNSTGDFVVQKCLKSQGYNIEDVKFIYAQQADCIEAMTLKPFDDGTPRATLGGLWAPNTYQLFNSVNGSGTLCSGASAYTTITGGHMTRSDFALQRPKTVAKILSGWLRAVTFINEPANKQEVLDYMAAFFEKHNVIIPREYLELDLKLVGLWELQQQLNLMERRDDPPVSNYDMWTTTVGNFMLENGVISELASPSTYIDDQFMRMVNEDPQLRLWALGQNPEDFDSAGADFHRPWRLLLTWATSTCLLWSLAISSPLFS